MKTSRVFVRIHNSCYSISCAIRDTDRVADFVELLLRSKAYLRLGIEELGTMGRRDLEQK